MNETQLKTHVWHHASNRCFFVSTIERDTSASCPPPLPRFMETIIFEFDWATMQRGKILAIANANYGIKNHFDACEQLWRTGEYREPE